MRKRILPGLAALLLLGVLAVPLLRESPGPASPASPHREANFENAPEATSPVVPPLETGAFLLGTVLDSEGYPVEEARISWFRVNEAVMVAPPGRKASTDRGGRFRMACPPVDRLVLVIRHPRYRDLTGRAEPGQEAIWRLEAGGSITGEVVTRDGKGVPGARVLAVGRGYRREPAGDPGEAFWGPGVDAVTARTDTSGRFEILGLGEGQYELAAAVPGMMREGIQKAAPVLLRPGEYHRFVLRPTFITAYRLVDRSTGQPLAVSGFHMVVPDIPYEPFWYLRSQEIWCGGAPLGFGSDPSGSACHIQLFHSPVSHVPPGATATVHALIPGYQSAKVKIPLQLPWTRGATEIHDVALAPTLDLGTVRARFLCSRGASLTGVRVRLLIHREQDGNELLIELVPGKGGVSEFRLPSGCYTARDPLEERGHGSHWRTTLRPVMAGERTDWELSLTSAFVVFGLVDPSGKPIRPTTHARASSAPGSGPVVLRSTRFGGGGHMRAGGGGPSVEGSRFALVRDAGLPPDIAGQQGPFFPGRRTFEVFCPRHAPARVTVDLSPGTVHRLTAVMEPIDTDDWYPPLLVDER